MLRATLRTALAHKGRLFLSALAVILGVAFVTGSLMLTNALDRTFVDIIEGSAQDVQITKESAIGETAGDPGDDSDPLFVSQEIVEQVQQVEGVAAAAGAITRNGVYLIDTDGAVVGAVGPPALGLNWEPNPELYVSTITEGRAPEANSEVVVDDVTFPKLGYAIGDQINVVTPQGQVEVELVGTFKFGETGGLAGATLTSFTTERAQELLTAPGEWTSVDVAVADGFTDQEVADNISAALDDSSLAVKTRAEQVSDQSDALRDGLAFFNYIMLGFAGISLFVAAFLIYNTFTMLVAQRSQELALLRAIGATRVQVLRSVLTEAFLMGLLAIVLGVALGYLLALGLAALFGSFGLSLTAGIALTPESIIVAAIVGLVVTMLSAVVPASRASRILPMEALRAASVTNEGYGKIRTLVGVILLVVAILMVFAGLGSEDGGTKALLTALGALLVLISVVVLSPILAIALVTVVSPLMRVLGPATGKLAAKNAARSPKRLATTASALTIGLGLVVSVTIITSSAKASLDSLIDGNFRADYIVGTLTFQPFSTDIADGIRQIDGVEYAVSETGGPAQIQGEEDTITAIGGGPLDSVYSVENVQGDFGVLEAGEAIVSSEMADDRGWEIGSAVPVTFPSGDSLDLTVVGEFEGNALISGFIMDLVEYREVGEGSQDRVLYVSLAEGADSDAVLAQIEDVAGVNPLLEVLDQTALKEQNAQQLDQLLFFVYAMLALSVIIAALGVVNTLALSVIERTREIGLLRAVGATRRQIRRIVRWEAILVSLLGAVLGIVAGIGSGIALQEALADSGIDVLDIPVTTLIVILVLAILIGILAAVLPARRAARLNILESIATE